MALLQKAYLGATPLFKDVAWYEDNYTAVNDSGEVTVTANSSAHTKGAWSELIASTSANASLLVLNVTEISASGVSTETLIDIGVGGSGSESAVIPNVAVGGALTSNTVQAGIIVAIPIKLASGSRISARIQSVVTGGKTAVVQAFLYSVGDYNDAPTSVDVIGGNTATSRGIEFSGGTGTWVQATASTSRAYRAVAYVPSLHTTTGASFTRDFDIGVGASGSEQEFGKTFVTYNTAEFVQSAPPNLTLFGRNIPAGSRLAARHYINSNSDRYGFTLIGIP
jgi:hypothetical protein